MKCDKNEAFPELVEKKYWKEVLNLLGERRGNANNVGDDSVITEVKEHNALYAIFGYKGITYKLKEDRVKGQYKSASNDYSSIREIPFDRIPRDKTVMLGGTLATHRCDACHGKGEVRCPACNGTGWCKHCNGQGYVIQQGSRLTCSCGGSGWCKECGGSKWVPCKSCNGTGYYQTYREFKASEKEEYFTYSPIDAIIPMIDDMGIESKELFNGTYFKMLNADEMEFSEIETLHSAIWDNFGMEETDYFFELTEGKCKEFLDKKNSLVYEKSAYLRTADIIEVLYEYRNKEYSLYIAKDAPFVYCYDSFPGRGAQWFRELFSSIKNIGKHKNEESEDGYQK